MHMQLKRDAALSRGRVEALKVQKMLSEMPFKASELTLVRNFILIFDIREVKTFLCILKPNFGNLQISMVLRSILRNHGSFNKCIPKIVRHRKCRILYVMTP